MKPSILIVDDDVVLGQVLSRVLSRRDDQVFIASNQTEALDLARVHEPRVALLDLCLSDGNGLQLAETLHLEHPNTALILMTAYPLRMREDSQVGRLFSRVLIKPLDVKELRETVEGLMGTMSCP
jgi:two-component system response regulator RegA